MIYRVLSRIRYTAHLYYSYFWECYMPLLILGLILFIAAHSTRIFTDDWRSHMLERLGEKPWKGLITVVSVAGFVLMIIGYGEARLVPVPLWEPPVLRDISRYC